MDVKKDLIKQNDKLSATKGASTNQMKTPESEIEEISPLLLPQIMPDLARPRHGFYHTVDSALVCLFRAGIPPERITIKKAGRGWRQHRIIDQRPEPGAHLDADIKIELTAEGDNAFYHLPTGMRSYGKDAEKERLKGTKKAPMVDDFMSLFDDPLEKAAFIVREGGLYFNVRPDNDVGCARWIRLFGLKPELWPRESWYRLAMLLPKLHREAGHVSGLRRALDLLLNLNVFAIQRRQRSSFLPLKEQSRLGERTSRLGTDFVIGDRMADESTMVITIGPVSLAIYREYQAEQGQHRLNQVLHLMLPYHLVYSIQWLVGNRSHAPRLEIEDENSVLGVNMHFGRK